MKKTKLTRFVQTRVIRVQPISMRENFS